MRNKALKLLIILFLVVGISSVGLAQRATTGILNGKAADDEGMPLPGVIVTASSPAMMLPQVSAVTDVKGFFRFLQLPPGVYKVAWELTGFQNPC